MPVNYRAIPDRFRLESLFHPSSVAVTGADGAQGAQVLANLLAGGFSGAVLPVVAAPAQSAAGVLAYPSIAALPVAPDLAIICEPTPDAPALFAQLAARGTYAAVVTGMSAEIREAARLSGVRALGPGSFGVCVPSIGLNATRGHLPPRPGRLALVSQSAALCRAVLDWAEPNGVGFSHIVGVGGNEDIGFALVLDWLARDPGTSAILLDIRRVKSARLFLSAARAAARMRPVVAIRAGSRLIDPEGDANAAFEAALRRAGVLSVATLEELLAAAETLTRVPRPRGAVASPDSLAIVTNAIGPAQLAADAALGAGVPLAALTLPTREVIRLAIPGAFATRGGADVPDGVGDIVYCGLDTPIKLAEAAALLSGAQEVGGVLLVHAPTGPADAAGMEAIAAAAAAMKLPLIVCAMGETTGAAHRRRLADAGVPVFATPEQAVRGFVHLVRHRRTREAARELPSRAVMQLDPDREAVATVLAAARTAGRTALDPAEIARVLAAYRIAAPSPGPLPGPDFALRIAEDGMFGPIIGIGQSDASGRGGHDLAIDLPPLNLVLARAQFARSRIAATLPAGAEGPAEAAAVTLVRASQLVVDFPEIAGVRLEPLRFLPHDPAQPDAPAASALAAELSLRPPGQLPPRLAIPPYPAELAEPLQAGAETLTLRPIRPEDAEAHGEFFRRLSPQDVRYRFFSALRELSPEQLARMTQVDYEREMAFVAVREPPGQPTETVGVARLVRESSAVAGQGDSGEFAVVVQPDMRGHGVAAALMRKLIAWGRAQGMTMIVGQVLADNAPMLAFVRRLGFQIRRMIDEPDVVEAWMALDPNP